MASVDQSYFGAPDFVNSVNRQTISSFWASCTLIGGGPETINLPEAQFVCKLCVEMSWRSSKMATVPGLFCVLLRAS